MVSGGISSVAPGVPCAPSFASTARRFRLRSSLRNCSDMKPFAVSPQNCGGRRPYVARDLRIARAGHNFYALTAPPHSAEEAPIMDRAGPRHPLLIQHRSSTPYIRCDLHACPCRSHLMHGPGLRDIEVRRRGRSRALGRSGWPFASRSKRIEPSAPFLAGW